MNKLLLILLLIVTFASCTNNQPLAFNNDDIEFSLPSGWYVKERLKPIVGDEIIVLQKGKYLPKGNFTISILKGKRDLLAILEFYEKVLQKQEVGIVTVEASFEAPSLSQFGSYESISSIYYTETLGVKMKGVIHTFHHSNKTFVVLGIVSIGADDAYEEAIVELERSFIVKSN